MRLEISGLSESFIAAIKGTDVGTIPCVNPDVSTKIEVEREPLTAAFKCTLYE